VGKPGDHNVRREITSRHQPYPRQGEKTHVFHNGAFQGSYRNLYQSPEGLTPIGQIPGQHGPDSQLDLGPGHVESVL
jgi:hypothetical protein